MKELYLLNVLSSIDRAFWIIIVILLFVYACWVFIYFIAKADEWAKIDIKFPPAYLWAIIAVFGLVICAIPSKKDMYIIFGIGTIIDYVETNNNAKELPDKTILCIDKLLNEYLEEDNK